MADQKLPALPLVVSLDGTEVYYTVQSSLSYKVSGNQLKAFINVPGGTNGQIQYNAGGLFGGFDVSGDGSLNTSTGALTISKIGSVPVSSNYVSKTGAYTAQANDFCIDCTSGTFSVNLPTASGIVGKQYCIKNSGSGIITVDANGSETIDGRLIFTLSTQYESIFIISDGANWKVI